ncbi:uncharacterized protein BDR25DRAFT_309571 [Lindgomyces ingoldianus]|uniref:Uncharacterized protein n=1 Tax=Lindgomyces ingoldianus TaxID=673940 RepID=A0ACB6RDJ1_9PLEO|nr:uncharacterized protein BDR25DRAFT_309571 [Lindgomyces ingoldianus]KAF2477314.1 hypothetical protein BDR25DRAFT_309571 [Lindgomyces ingoldianus]
MYFTNLNFISTLSLLPLTYAMASPMDPPASLKCHCITFPPQPSSHPCNIAGSQDLSWHSARTFAASHNLPLYFASQDTISKVLHAQHPLPTSLLLSMDKQSPFFPQASITNDGTSRVICEVDDELRRKWMKQAEKDGKRGYDVFILQVVMILLLLIIGFEAGSVVWTSLHRAFFKKSAPIRLSGEEKCLTAITTEYNTSSTSGSEKHADATIPRLPVYMAQNTPQICGHMDIPWESD